MPNHESIERLYASLLELNPLFGEYAQITKTSNPKILEELERPNKYYTENGSLLFDAFCEPILKYIGDVPSIIKYRIVIAIGTNDKGGPSTTSHNYKGCKFYDEFFIEPPGKIKLTWCDYDHDVDRREQPDMGEWCEGCHGPFGKAANLHKIMQLVAFKDIPKKAIYYIEELVEPVTGLESLAKAIKIMEKEREQVLELQQAISTTTESIKKIIEQEVAKIAEYKSTLEKMLSAHGSVDALSEKIAKMGDRIREMEYGARLTKLLEDRAKLDEQIDECKKNVNPKQASIELTKRLDACIEERKQIDAAVAGCEMLKEVFGIVSS